MKPAEYIAELTEALHGIEPDQIETIGKMLCRCWRSERRLFVAGNGGSAATASHLCVDLCKGLACVPGGHMPVRRGIDAFCLTDNVPSLTAWSNDACYGMALADQMMSIGRESDYLLVITGSGNSRNIVEAVKSAFGIGMVVIVLTGMGGGAIGQLFDIPLPDKYTHPRHMMIVPSDNMQVIEDCHSIICHAVYCYLRDRAAEEPKPLVIEAKPVNPWEVMGQPITAKNQPLPYNFKEPA